MTRTIDGKLHEPLRGVTIDCPEEFVGAITQLMANRKGRMEQMTNHAAGWVRMDFVVPSRGLIGFRTDFLTLTRNRHRQRGIRRLPPVGWGDPRPPHRFLW